MILESGPGYSCATTPATAQAAAECSEGKDVPPLRKNGPLPLPWYGLSRPKGYFSPSTTTRLFTTASPARNPVSLQCSLCEAWPESQIPPAPPTSAPTPTLDSVL